MVDIVSLVISQFQPLCEVADETVTPIEKETILYCMLEDSIQRYYWKGRYLLFEVTKIDEENRLLISIKIM